MATYPKTTTYKNGTKTVQHRSDAEYKKYMGIYFWAISCGQWLSCSMGQIYDGIKPIETLLFIKNASPHFWQFGDLDCEWQENIGGIDYKFAKTQNSEKYFLIRTDMLGTGLTEMSSTYTEISESSHIKTLDLDFNRGNRTFIFV